MKTKKYIMIMSILILIFITLMSQGNIGVSKYNMEKDARKSQKIQEDWLTAKYINDDFGAFLFYSKDLSEYTFSIYQNRSGFSFGYFFIQVVVCQKFQMILYNSIVMIKGVYFYLLIR